MTRVYRWQDNTLSESLLDVSDLKYSLHHCLSVLREGLVKQGRNPITVQEAMHYLPMGDFIIVAADTWIAAFEVGRPWMSNELFLAEEFMGPRNMNAALDLEDFVAGATALAKELGADVLEFGTRTNPRHLAMAKLCTRLGAEVAAITLSKEIL